MSIDIEKLARDGLELLRDLHHERRPGALVADASDEALLLSVVAAMIGEALELRTERAPDYEKVSDGDWTEIEPIL